LRKGVLCRGQFRYREHNSGTQGVEDFPDFRSEKREELLLAAVEELVRRGEQVLAFVPDRATTVLFARVLAQRVTPASATAAVEELRQQEETLARETLLGVLSGAVAFHNSDLSPEEREIIERHFRGGAIRALFSTSTLAVGMNLPVKNVVLDHQRWEYLRRYGRWSLQEISRSEYENMSGRAGRLSLVQDFGRSILVTYSPFEADVWLEHFAGGEFEEIRPTLADAPLENHVLDLMASGLASTRGELEEMLLSSFTGWTHWAQKISRAEFSEALTKAVSCGLDGGLLRGAAPELDHLLHDLAITVGAISPTDVRWPPVSGSDSTTPLHLTLGHPPLHDTRAVGETYRAAVTTRAPPRAFNRNPTPGMFSTSCSISVSATMPASARRNGLMTR